VAFSSQLKSKVNILAKAPDNILTKAPALRSNLNIDDTPIASRSHTHPLYPSHTQTSHLLTSSLSFGVPVPHVTQCIRGVLTFALSIHNKLVEFILFIEEINRELKRLHIDGCRWNERLKAKTEGSTRLSYTMSEDILYCVLLDTVSRFTRPPQSWEMWNELTDMRSRITLSYLPDKTTVCLLTLWFWITGFHDDTWPIRKFKWTPNWKSHTVFQKHGQDQNQSLQEVMYLSSRSDCFYLFIMNR